jgi:hypothetical protein
MSSLDRAKKFLASKARILALAVVPLAAVTDVAQAAPLTFSSSGCSVNSLNNGQVASGSFCEVNLGTGGVDGINSIAVFGGGFVNFSPFEGSNYGIEFSATGSGDGGESPSGILPLAWDFSIGDAFNTTNLNWYLQFIFWGAGSGSYFYATSGSGTGQFKGSTVMEIASSGINAWNVSLQITGDVTEVLSGGGFAVDIPPGTTLDVNPVGDAVPEPSSLLLALPAGAFLLVRRRMKRSA